MVSSALGSGCTSLRKRSFNGLRSVYMQTSPLLLGATTIPAHHTECDSQLWRWFPGTPCILTPVLLWGVEDRGCVSGWTGSLNGLVLGWRWISYPIWMQTTTIHHNRWATSWDIQRSLSWGQHMILWDHRILLKKVTQSVIIIMSSLASGFSASVAGRQSKLNFNPPSRLLVGTVLLLNTIFLLELPQNF